MISEKEYAKRRSILAKKLSSNSVSVLYSAEEKSRSNDTEYPYRQNSNFYYMCGFKEANSALVFVKKRAKTKVYLFVEAKDEKLELWSGKRVGEIEAKKRFLVDDVFVIKDFNLKLKDFLQDKLVLYFDFNLQYNKVKVIKRYSKNVATYKNIALMVNEMRLIKSKSEINIIREAIAITKEAHHSAMRMNKGLKKEFEVQAEIEYVFKKMGAYSDAYTSIVACGNSANTLHYIENDRTLTRASLILIDAGCEFEYYASDITRTIPVDGKFTKPQKELYEMVLDVQLKIIGMIEPDFKRSKLQEKAVELLSQGMLDLGILKGSLKKIIKEELYKKYYPHGIGHWMGIDVHDECPYKYENSKEIPFKPGMVLTIEPGIYIDENDKSVPKKYRGIGIRIEDDILVTESGRENLSEGIAKSVEEVEGIYSSL